MSHLIETTNGRAEIAYAGKTPWHGLGQALTPDAPIDVWQREAGLDWRAVPSQVQFVTGITQGDPDPIMHLAEYKDQHVVYRSDTLKPLGLVTKRYHVHQPEEILNFFNTLVQSAGFSLEVAGAIKGGKRIWALANVNREACVLGDDAVRGYLLLSTSFDGSTATIGQFTSVRVVCNNTLSMADRESAPSRVSLTHGSRFDASSMRQRLGLVVSGFEGMMDGYRALARQQVNTAFVNSFLSKFYPAKVNEENGTQRVHRGYAKVMELFEGRGMGADLQGAAGTKWGLLNAMSQYIDHERGRNVDSRLTNAWFGNGNRMKQEAEAILLSTV